jgi:C4-dicarboxylate-specific signal transduction histidine kinase
VVSTLSAATLLGEVKESTRRISELVAAVKSYSQLDRASVQPTDVTEGLESTLVMLKHRIPPGVSVLREYATDVPRIDAIAGELNQVWTNLIENAIDAMDGTGTLRVSAQPDGDGLVVEIIRYRVRHVSRGAGPRVRAVLHHQGRRQGHRARAGHLASRGRRPAPRRDHHRQPAGGDGAEGRLGPRGAS